MFYIIGAVILIMLYIFAPQLGCLVTLGLLIFAIVRFGGWSQLRSVGMGIWNFAVSAWKIVSSFFTAMRWENIHDFLSGIGFIL